MLFKGIYSQQQNISFKLKSLQRQAHAVKATTIHDTQNNVDLPFLGSQPKQTKLNSFKLLYKMMV